MSEQIIRPGMYVSLTYSIADDAGNILEQTDLPVGYIHGGNTELIGGLDDAVFGRQAGDRFELTLDPDQGFGPHDPDLTFTDKVANVPPEYRFVGAEVPMQNESGEVKTFYVTRIGEDTLTIDGNHPLAGKSLKVQVQIREVRDPTADEIAEDGAAGGLPGPSIH
ncbi:MAG: peptidylprolyl isomerase [Chromatiaceae bacterium]|jgi:FKBP-type peptidyl-prolyl cis-trans isomerase SlyD